MDVEDRLVHPHACGEQPKANARAVRNSGSSPRMWGTDVARACFGAARTVHPHACGEQSMIMCGSSGNSGSSPRMWGTVVAVISPRSTERFIPTHVGNSITPSVAVAKLPVHPHACGEQFVISLNLKRRHGSSPRMWGTVHPDRRSASSRRFIPTHVGNRPFLTHC